MEIIIGSDHGGFKLKQKIVDFLRSKNIEVHDLGTHSDESCDYPKIAEKVARKVAEDGGFGILVCGTGIGMSISANKVKGIRAALAYNEHTAEMARLHNDANILCIGERTTKEKVALKIVETFLSTERSDEPRHKRRVNEISEMENK